MLERRTKGPGVYVACVPALQVALIRRDLWHSRQDAVVTVAPRNGATAAIITRVGSGTTGVLATDIL